MTNNKQDLQDGHKVKNKKKNENFKSSHFFFIVIF